MLLLMTESLWLLMMRLLKMRLILMKVFMLQLLYVDLLLLKDSSCDVVGVLDGIDVPDFVLAASEAFAVAAVEVAFGLELDFRHDFDIPKSCLTLVCALLK
ncbi:uncharacterized protein LOC119653644 [Hermetia illucens]|uniref:uncharacterized protein LOC119653644 n=1 Tax=Hermetia illucens TaxID=343691 RepID=UPI0018CC0A91|nr:uncharacterized protein LOC119653644 [Hermetia illucens]